MSIHKAHLEQVCRLVGNWLHIHRSECGASGFWENPWCDDTSFSLSKENHVYLCIYLFNWRIVSFWCCISFKCIAKCFRYISQVGVVVETHLQCRRCEDTGLIPESGRSPGEGNGNLFQYSCLGSPTGRGAWGPTVHGVAKSQTWLSIAHTYTYSLFQIAFHYRLSWYWMQYPMHTVSPCCLLTLYIGIWYLCDLY